MRNVTLIVAAILIIGCSPLPSKDEQASVIARQSFGKDYRFAVTSWNKQAQIQTAEHLQKNENPAFFDLIKNLQNLLTLDGAEWTLLNEHYNNSKEPSSMEKVIAKKLAKEFGVKSEFLPRPDFAVNVTESKSPMLAAKSVALKGGFDGIALLYFQPNVKIEKISGDEVPKYRLSFNYHLAVRSVTEDALMYSKIGLKTCSSQYEQIKLSSGIIIERETDKVYPPCEQEIVASIIDEFLTFARNARVN